jgi:hypothetical protein
VFIKSADQRVDEFRGAGDVGIALPSGGIDPGDLLDVERECIRKLEGAVGRGQAESDRVYETAIKIWCLLNPRVRPQQFTLLRLSRAHPIRHRVKVFAKS